MTSPHFLCCSCLLFFIRSLLFFVSFTNLILSLSLYLSLSPSIQPLPSWPQSLFCFYPHHYLHPLTLIPLGTSWGLDGGYTGSSSTVLYSIAMYTSQIGVVGTGRNSDQTQTTFVRNPGNFKHCHSVSYSICSRVSVFCPLSFSAHCLFAFVIICHCFLSAILCRWYLHM